MRVLLTSHTYAAPGNQAKLAALAAVPDVELTVVIPAQWQDRLFTLHGATAQGAYRLITLPTLGLQRPNTFTYRANLHQLLSAVAPDILHIEQEPRSLAATHWLWANRGRAKSLIFTWENIEQPRRVPLSQFERYVLRRANGLVGGNAASIGLLRAKNYRGLTRILPQLGVDLFDERATPLPIQLDLNNQFVVGFVGRLVDEKGLGDLVQAVQDVPNTHLLILGGGPWRSRLATLPNVTVCPTVPHAEVPAYLAAMHVLVLPSRTLPKWKEQFGHVLIEAMACGVPVIGSDSGAIPEVIADAGLIFPEGDVAALRAAIVRLRDDAALRAEFSAKGRARVLAHYTHQRIAEQTVAIYRELLQR